MQNDLISRKALIGRLAYYHAHSYGKAEYAYGVATEEVVKAPTIDAVPVVHGQWVETGKVFVHSMYDLFTECSLCSFRHVRNEYQEPYHYCPNCGAKMDAKDANATGKPEDCRYFTSNSYWGAGCLGTKEIDRCEGEGCKRWVPKMDGGADE